MKKRDVSSEFQVKIRRYLEYMHELENLGAHRGEHLLKDLSGDLLEKLKTKSYGKFLKKLVFFKNMKFSKQLLKKLSTQLTEKIFAPQEIINIVFFYNFSFFNFFLFLNL